MQSSTWKMLPPKTTQPILLHFRRERKAVYFPPISARER
jgi:hypothetical protein